MKSIATYKRGALLRKTVTLLVCILILAIISTTTVLANTFVQDGAIVVDGTFGDWGNTGTPTQGIYLHQDLANVSPPDGSGFAGTAKDLNYFWCGMSTLPGGTEHASPSNTIRYIYYRIDTFETSSSNPKQTYNIQLNLGTASAGLADHLLQIHVDTSLTPPVRIVLHEYNSPFPPIGAYTSGSVAGKVSNISNPYSGYEGVVDSNASGAWNKIDGSHYGLEVKIPISWYGPSFEGLVKDDGSGAPVYFGALFTSTGVLQGVGQIKDTMNDASGNRILFATDTVKGDVSTNTIANITATKTDSLYLDADVSGSPSAGDTLLYTVTLSNTGTASATSVVFTDNFTGSGLLFADSATSSLGTVTTTANSVQVSIPTLAVAASANITFRATVAQPFPSGLTQVSNQGLVTASGGISTLTDDPATVTPNDATITHITRVADAAQSTLTPTSASIAPDGTSTQVLTVTAMDAGGNPVAEGGATVTITKLSGTGTIGSVTDNGDGTYTATVTSASSAGSGVFVATLNGQEVKSGGASQTQSTVTYESRPEDASKSTLTPTAASITADGVSTQVLTVTAKDNEGTTLSTGGATVTITKSSGTGTISSVTDNDNGTYTATVTSPTSAGSGVFVATIGGQPVKSNDESQTQATVTYAVGAANATQSTLTPTSASITADGVSTQILTVTAKDASGNTLSSGGATVTITRLSGIGTIGSVTDNGDGTYAATVTSVSSGGSGVFVATLNGQEVKSGGASQTQATVTYTAGAADAAQSTLTPTSSSITADGASTQVLTVIAKDAFGNVLSSGSATVTITKSSGTGTIGSVTDNGDGTYTATVTSASSAGSGVFVATLNGQEVKSGGASQTQATVTYAAGVINKLVFLTPARNIVAGEVSEIMTIQTQGAADNPVNVGSDATINLTSTSPTGKFYSDAAGTHEITSVTITAGGNSASFYYRDTAAGTPSITVDENPSQGWAPAVQQETIIPGPIAKLIYLTPAQTAASGTTTGIITVQVQDAYGNPVTVADNTVINLTSTSPTGRFYSDAAGIQQITSVTITAGGSSASFYYSDTAPGSHIIMATSPAMVVGTQIVVITGGGISPVTSQGISHGAGGASSQSVSKPYIPVTPIVNILTIQPQVARINELVTIRAQVSNAGLDNSNYTASLRVNGELEAYRSGTVNGRASVPVEFSLIRSEPGNYLVDLNGQTAYVTIKSDEGLVYNMISYVPLIGFFSCLLGILIVSILLIRKRHPQL